MKIILANKFFYLNGGSEQVFFQERRSLQDQGHSVIDFSMTDERNFSSDNSSYFIPTIDYNNCKGIFAKLHSSASFIHSSVAVKQINKLILQEKPQIAHLHNVYHQLTPSIIPILKKQGIKIVLTLHDFKLVCPSYLALRGESICNDCAGIKFWKPFTTNCQDSRFKGLLLSLEALFHQWRGSYDLVDCFIAPSQFLAKLVQKRVGPEKIHLLHNGIDTDAWQPYQNDEGYGLYLGRLSKEKGIKTLLTAYAGLEPTFPLKIAGTGPLEKELQARYRCVEFLGYQSGQALKDLIGRAAFVVVPSEWYENCSMAVLEAMALGKPIIASRIGGLPEQITDGETGLLFEMGNPSDLAQKMEILADNPTLRASMGQAARIKLEKEYSLKDHCASLVQLYEDLLR